jgi:exodeoxyribonuclease VII small subunit
VGTMADKIDSKGFEDNFRKLEQLSVELQENRISIDALVPRMKEALEAIKVCKNVLKETRAQLKEINNEFSELASGAADEQE